MRTRCAFRPFGNDAGGVRREYKTFHVAPLDPAQFDFRLCAGGRLVDCINKDWTPIIRADIGLEVPYEFPLYVGLYRGQWLALR